MDLVPIISSALIGALAAVASAVTARVRKNTAHRLRLVSSSGKVTYLGIEAGASDQQVAQLLRNAIVTQVRRREAVLEAISAAQQMSKFEKNEAIITHRKIKKRPFVRSYQNQDLPKFRVGNWDDNMFNHPRPYEGLRKPLYRTTAHRHLPGEREQLTFAWQSRTKHQGELAIDEGAAQ